MVAAEIVFDVTGTVAGIAVFQPFELVAGAEALATQPKVVDGDRGVPGVIPGNSVLEFQVQLLGVKKR
ncbi:MAG: hypothetical protein U1E02_39505 [Hydrogenophaga sp.]|nr:hypothetical protein [Hydrogenophaga sp.]